MNRGELHRELEAVNRVPYQRLFATKIKLGYVFRMTRSVHRLLAIYN